MSVIPSNIPNGVSDYTAVLLRLLPRGVIWPTIQEYTVNYFVKLLAGLADELERVDASIKANMLEAAFPDSTDSTFLPDWERVLGLPLVDDVQTVAKRRQMVMAFLNLSELSNAAFFVDLAAMCGYAIYLTYDTTIAGRFRVSDAAAHESGKLDSVGQQLMVGEAGSFLTWQVHVTAIPDGGSMAEIEAVIRRFQPCYCDVTFIDETT